MDSKALSAAWVISIVSDVGTIKDTEAAFPYCGKSSLKWLEAMKTVTVLHQLS